MHMTLLLYGGTQHPTLIEQLSFAIRTLVLSLDTVELTALPSQPTEILLFFCHDVDNAGTTWTGSTDTWSKW